METFILILKFIACAATVATGLLALIKPTAIYGFTGMRAEGPRGITEIRSIFGALFIALGLVPILIRDDKLFAMLGIVYLAIAIVRAVSMFLDKSVEKSNIISLVTEVVLGIILVL